MDRLGFFKHGLSSLFDAASTVVGLKQAVNSFTEVVDEALSNIKTDIGLHLPSLDAGMYDDPQGTLSEVARIGYSMIEVGSYYGGKIHNMAPEKFKELANRYGLKITSAHLNHLYEVPTTEGAEVAEGAEAKKGAGAKEGAGDQAEVIEAAEATAAAKVAAEKTAKATMAEEATANAVEANAVNGAEEVTEATAQTQEKPDPNDEWWCQALDIHRDMGCRYIVMSRLPDYPTDEVVAQYATYFNRIGELAAERGMQFCYHPREIELKVADGKSIFESIVANTDPEKVCFEIDTYEAHQAGVDVNELLKRLTKRITLLHIRDYGILGESEKIDFEKIVAEGIRTGVKDIFVEVRNFTLPPINSIERSFFYVEDLPSISY